VNDGIAAGASLVAGGSRTSSPNGYFVAPTVLKDVSPDSALWREEIFGPVLAIATFDSVDEALAIANDSVFGLSASIWTQDLALALRAVREVQAGRVWVNTTLDNGPETPLGGMKQSGLGRDAGMTGIEEYTELKTAHINLLPRQHWLK
jgi:betaine-aldehyde dehydrogenase